MFSSIFKMAARDLVVRTSSVQLWNEWAERRGINIDDNTDDDTDEDTEEDAITVNEQTESHAIKLRKQDMKIFGCCPSKDDVFLVVCEMCNPHRVVKPQCLKDHYEVRHPGFQIKYWKGKSETTTQYSRTSVTKVAPSQNRTSTSKHHGKSAASKNNSNHSSTSVLTSHSPTSTSRSERPKSVPKSKKNNEGNPVIGTGLVSRSLVQIAHSPLNTLPVNKELPSPQKPPPDIPVRTSIICSTEEQNVFSNSPISVQSAVSVVPQNVVSTSSEENLFSREEAFSKKSTLSNKSKKIPNKGKQLSPRDREYDPNIHCGVVMNSNGRHCTSSAVTCKKHSMSRRRAVLGRTRDFNDILSDHRAATLKTAKTKQPPFSKEIESPTVPRTEHVTMETVSKVQSPSTDTTAIKMIAMTTTSPTIITNNLITSLGSSNVDIIGASNQPKLPGITVPYVETSLPVDYHQLLPNRNQFEDIHVSLNMDLVMNDVQEQSQPIFETKQRCVQPVVKQEILQPIIENHQEKKKQEPVMNIKAEKPVEAECVYIRGLTPDPAYITRSPLPYTVSMFGLKRLNNGPIVAHCKYANSREAFRIATSINKSDNSQPVANVPVISRSSSLTVKQESEQLDVKYSEPAIILPLRQTAASELNVSMNKDNVLTSDTLPSILCATIAARNTQSILEVSVPSPQPQPKTSKSKEKSSYKKSLNGPPIKRKRTSTHVVPNGTSISQAMSLSTFPYYGSDVPPAHMKQPISLSSAFSHAFIENSAAVVTRHSVAERNCLPMPLEIIPNPIPQYSSTAHLAQGNDYLTLAARNGQVPMPGNIVHSLTVNKVMPPVGTGLGITLGEAGLVRPLSHLPSKCSSPEDLRISTSSNKNSHMIKSILSSSPVSPNSSASSGPMWSRTKTKPIKSPKISKTSAVTNSVLQNMRDVTSLSILLQNSSNVTNPNAVNNSLSHDVGHFLNVFQANSSSATHPSLLHPQPNPIAPSSLLHSGSSSPSVHVSPLHNGMDPSLYYNHHTNLTSLSPVSPTSTNSRETGSSDGSTGNGQKVWQQNSGGISHHMHQQTVYNINLQRKSRQKK